MKCHTVFENQESLNQLQKHVLTSSNKKMLQKLATLHLTSQPSYDVFGDQLLIGLIGN